MRRAQREEWGLSRFLSERFRSARPYVPGEQPQGGQRYIKLNTNESPFPPSPRVTAAITAEEVEKLRLYSDPDARPLTAAIARRYGVDGRQVFVGNGSDEVLAFAFLAFGSGGKAFRFPALSYGFYPVFARLFGVEFEAVPLREDFTIDPADYIGCGKNVVIANPNAPTGLALGRRTIGEIARSNPDSVVLVDEAYVDFGGESAVPLLGEHDNLLIVQTFSKSRSLAGMRVGFALGSPGLIGDLQQMKFSFNPYNLDRLAILAGTAAMEDEAYFCACTEKVCATRRRVTGALRALGFTVLESKANFVFAKPAGISGEALFTALRARGVLTRRWDEPLIRDYLRISIGSDEEMDAFLQKTAEILREAGA